MCTTLFSWWSRSSISLKACVIPDPSRVCVLACVLLSHTRSLPYLLLFLIDPTKPLRVSLALPASLFPATDCLIVLHACVFPCYVLFCLGSESLVPPPRRLWQPSSTFRYMYNCYPAFGIS